MLELNDKPSSVTTSSTDFSLQNLVFFYLFEFSAAEITLGGLAHENGFSPAYLFSSLRLVKTQQSCAPTRQECNKYDLIPAPYFSLANHNGWYIWFVISNSHLFVIPISILWVELQKNE
jgi:hypothetical protein